MTPALWKRPEWQRPGRRDLLSLALAGMGIGCASPEPAFYTLAPVPGIAARGGPALVELRRPGLAGYLDRPEIVRSNGAYVLRVAGAERWGEPLGDLINRILAENLGQRLPGSNVFLSGGSITAEATAIVELNIQRFDGNASASEASGPVILLAQVSVSRRNARAPAAPRIVRLSVTPATASTPDLVAAMSDALGQLADTVAAMLRPSRA